MKKLVLRFLFKVNILQHLNFTLNIFKAGKKFKIPLFGNAGLDHFFNEKEMWMIVVLRCLNKITKGKGCFVDVGANIGQTLLKIKCLNNDWKYIGFEPNPHCLQYLYALIRLNQFSNVQLLPLGLSDRSGIGNLGLFSESLVDSAASVIDGFRARVITSFPVPVMRYDEIHNLFDNALTVVKIDVEGSEREVLTGLRSIIQRDQPFIICEILPIYERSNDRRLNRQLELEQVLSELNYLKFRIHVNGGLSLCREIGVHDSIENVNYLFCPLNAHDTVVRNFQFIS